MLRKINQTEKKHSNRNEKRNTLTQTLVKLTILIAVVLLQVGFRPDLGLARTTLVYAPYFAQGDDSIIRGQMRWSYDDAGTFSDRPIIAIWNGGGSLELDERWTAFYDAVQYPFKESDPWHDTVIQKRKTYCKDPGGGECEFANFNTRISISVTRINGWGLYVQAMNLPAKYALVKLTYYNEAGFDDAALDRSTIGSSYIFMKYVGQF